ITDVTNAFGRTAHFFYDQYDLLTNITDAVNLRSSVIYNELGWPTNLTTPYGTTTFAPVAFDVGVGNINRYITITEPNNGTHFFAFAANSFEPGTIDSSRIPTNTPVGTLDDEYAALDTYYWSPLQYGSLSTNDPSTMTANDFVKARMRHWLGRSVEGQRWKIDTISVQRDPSQDGTTEGQLTWFDYNNKSGPVPLEDQGDHILPAVI